MTPPIESRPKAEPPDEDEGIDGVHARFRFKKRRIAHARRPAMDGDRGDRRRFEHERRNAGDDSLVLRVADKQARNVRDEVAHRGRET